MLVVRKEGKEHARYNSFRSAFELLEAVGREPQDIFEETERDLPPLQRLQDRMQMQIDALISEVREMKTELHEVKDQNKNFLVENNSLRSRLDKLEKTVTKEIGLPVYDALMTGSSEL